MKDLFPKEVVDELQRGKKNDIALLKGKFEQLIYSEETYSSPPLINQVKQWYADW